MNTSATEVFACNMAALTPEQRERHLQTSPALFGRIEVIQELPQGYAFRLPTEQGIIQQAADFITYERL